MTPEQFAAANTNGDDGLSLEELQAQAAADFAAADKERRREAGLSRAPARHNTVRAHRGTA